MGPLESSLDVCLAAQDPINDPNVAYALHFYARPHRNKLRQKARQALTAGIPRFVTEWGTVEVSGS